MALAQKIAHRLKHETQNLSTLLLHLSKGDSRERYIYVSHHKCATQYVIRILRAASEARGFRTVKCDWRRKITRRTLLFNKFIMIQDYSRKIVDINQIRGRGFHVIRDPRDILSSMYFSHRDSHASTYKANEIMRNREVLNQCNQENGLLYLMDNSQYFSRVVQEMNEWNYHQPNFYETTFEDLITEPQAEFHRIFEHIDFPISKDDINNIVGANNFKVLQKEWTDKQPDKAGNHYRKGKIGDWQNHLTGNSKAVFKERYGQLLIKLGYEQDDCW